MAAASKVRTGNAFVTAQFATTKIVRGEARRVAASEVHAKWRGSLQTACGQTATTWFKFWDQPFDPSLQDACPACTSAVVASWARHGRSDAVSSSTVVS